MDFSSAGNVSSERSITKDGEGGQAGGGAIASARTTCPYDTARGAASE